MNREPQEDWKVIIARNVEQIEAIRPIWEKMQNEEPRSIINADINHYCADLEFRNGTTQPYVIVLYHHNKPESIVVGRIEKQEIACGIGYLKILKPSLRCLLIVYGGVLGRPAHEAYSVLIAKLLNVLSRGEADVILFNHLRMDSPMYHLSRGMPFVLCRDRFSKTELHWTMAIPKDVDVLYKSFAPKTRNTIKRKAKKLEREFAGQIEIVVYRDKSDVERALSDASSISIHTYQIGLGVGLVNDSQTRKFLEDAASHGWLRMSVLYIKGEPCSFQLGLQYKKTYFLKQLGFDPKWKQWSVGTVLFKKIMEDLCHDPVVERLDFGFGDAQYKTSYGNEHWTEAAVHIFAPRIYPMFVNMLHVSTQATSLLLKFIFNKLGLVSSIKRNWRRLLSTNS